MLSHVRKLKNPFSALKNEKKNQSYQKKCYAARQTGS